jgi:DNA-binding beta-propeller fold protein YncE
VTSYLTAGQGRPYFITMNPDGRRAYVVHQGSNGQTPAAEVIDADPASAGFGQAFPGPSVPLGVIDAMNMVFSPDGNIGYIATLGLFGSAQILQVDTNPASPGYNTVVGTISFPGLTCWAIDIDRNGVFLYAAVGGLVGPMQIAFINAPAFQETSIPRITIGRQISNIKLDPRGRTLYIAEYGNLAVLNVDQASPGFGQLTHIGAGGGTTGLAVSDAGDWLYVGQAGGGSVLEFDTATMTQTRTFAIGNNITYITFR